MEIGKATSKETLKKKHIPITKRINNYLKNIKEETSANKNKLICDLGAFAVGFLLSRCHLIFGAHPVGIAFICSLSGYIFPSLVGAAIGALSMGIGGIVFAAVTVISMLLRAAISCSDEGLSDIKNLFKENLLMRMSVGVISGFLAAVYEVLLNDFSRASLFFGLTMIISTPILTFLFSGLFSTGITLTDILENKSDFLSTEDKSGEERYNVIFFRIAALSLIFFIGLSFKGVDILGISISYLFAAGATLFTAKRFGPVAAMAVGFSSAVGISGVLSVAFALGGLGTGILYAIGRIYALIGGGMALVAFSAYAMGLEGVLSVLPEYIIASTVFFPFLKPDESLDSTTEQDGRSDLSEEMVGTMALAYQSKYSGKVDRMESALSNLADIVSDFVAPSQELTLGDFRDMVIGIAECHCVGCPEAKFCSKEGIRPCIKNADSIAAALMSDKQIVSADINQDNEFCPMAEIIAECINREAGIRRMENFRIREISDLGKEYRLISSLVGSAVSFDDGEKRLNSDMTEPLSNAVKDSGIKDGTIRAFGNRRKKLIFATEDPTGIHITSNSLKRNIEKKANISLSAQEYYRKGKMALMECETNPKYQTKIATSSRQGHEKEVSGDSLISFSSPDDLFYAIISDGMGSGDTARDVSRFVSRFLRGAMEGGLAKNSSVLMLNRALKASKDECSATVDLFEFDMMGGEGIFLKCGAAPSYIKRGSSVFRVRSKTAPLGLLSSIDAEKTKIDLRAGDHIIMLSDGVADEGDDAPWLLLLLGKPPKENLKEYADLIIEEAIKNCGVNDDMSVMIIRIEEA